MPSRPDHVERPKILVCGSRDWGDYRAVQSRLEALAATNSDLLIIAGDATGADAMALRWAHRRFPKIEVTAAWDRGRRAGPERNRIMLDLMPDRVIAFPGPESVGTWDTINEARRRGIYVDVFDV